jgi:beta-galactosidase
MSRVLALFVVLLGCSKVASAASGVRIAERRLIKDNKPFFPVGFVFGTTDADLKRARELGANSVHDEFSLLDVHPEGPESVYAPGIQRLHEVTDRVAKHGLTFFPLMNGHYLPKWLEATPGGAPVDVSGSAVGLWFGRSLYDPTFRSTLRTYWHTVAKELGEHPSIGAFVTWNEPAYGLDATPFAQRAFREWLQQLFHSIDAANASLGTTFHSFEEIPAPILPDTNRHLWSLWVRFHQESFARLFEDERQVFKSIAPGANLSGKFPTFTFTGASRFVVDGSLLAAAQDVPGVDGYSGSVLRYRDNLEVARSLSGNGPVITYETHPQRQHALSDPSQSVLQLFAQLVGGARGLFYFCFGSQDREHGFESDTGTPPPIRKELTRLFQLIRDHQTEFSAPRRPAEIAIVLSNASAIHFGTVSDAAHRDNYSLRLLQTYDLLRNQHFAVDFLPESQLTADRMTQYQLVVLPSLTILTNEQIEQLASFQKNGGRVLAFGASLERDELFRPIALPKVLGVASRGPPRWERGATQIVSVSGSLRTFLSGELTVQRPEAVNETKHQEIPGAPVKASDAGALAMTMDAGASIVLGADGHAIYCGFDSLYSEELSRLLGGVLETSWGLKREVSVRTGDREATEIITALNEDDDQQVLLIGNASPQPGRWKVSVTGPTGETWRSLRTKKPIANRGSAIDLALPAYGYDILVRPRLRTSR